MDIGPLIKQCVHTELHQHIWSDMIAASEDSNIMFHFDILE